MNDRMKLPDVRSKRVKNMWHSQAQAGLTITAKRKLERRQFSTSSSFVKT